MGLLVLDEVTEFCVPIVRAAALYFNDMGPREREALKYPLILTVSLILLVYNSMHVNHIYL
jgi:hypothetical protein